MRCALRNRIPLIGDFLFGTITFTQKDKGEGWCENMLEVTIKGFDNVFAIHLGKKPITVTQAIDIVFLKQKKDPEDTVDIYQLTSDKYEFVKDGEVDVLPGDTVLLDGDVLTLLCKQSDDE